MTAEELDKARRAQNAYRREWNRRNPEKNKENARRWRAENKEKVREYNLRYWAKRADRQAAEEQEAREEQNEQGKN